MSANPLGEDDRQLLETIEPPDPVDILHAHLRPLEESEQTKPLDFVRAKFQELKKENKQLKARVADLEQTLMILQTAQDYALGGEGITAKEKAKRDESFEKIRGLLEAAKKAREELNSFSNVSRTGLYEKLRVYKNALKREREEKAEMKNRLLHAFDYAKSVKEKNRKLMIQREEHHQLWSAKLKDMKDWHHTELRRLKGDEAVMASDRHDLLSRFGEQMIGELNALQQHLKEVRQETVDAVVLDGEDFEEGLIEDSGDLMGSSMRRSGQEDDDEAFIGSSQ